jgi:hypothetical protein
MEEVEVIAAVYESGVKEEMSLAARRKLLNL